jgi:hypothetical protein
MRSWSLVILTLLIAGCGAELGDEELLAAGQGHVFSLASDGDAVYWSGTAGLNKLSLTGINVTSYGDAPFTLGLAVDADTVYWATTSAVMMAPKAGGEPVVIADEQGCVFAMAVDDEHLYWANFAEGTIWSYDKATGVTESEWLGGRSTSIAVDGERVYWVDTAAGAIMVADKDGEQPWVLASGQQWPVSLVVDGEHVYWAARDGGVFRVDRDGGEPLALAAEEPMSNFVSVMAVDHDDVYWVTVYGDDELDGHVRRVPKSGGATDIIGRADPLSIAVDEGAVYWSTTDGDIVMRAK